MSDRTGEIEMCDIDEVCCGKSGKCKKDTPKCGFAWKVATALEDIQRAAYEHGKKADIDIQTDFITIEFKEKKDG